MQSIFTTRAYARNYVYNELEHNSYTRVWMCKRRGINTRIPGYGSDLPLIHYRLRDNVGESSTLQELHSHPQFLLDQIAVDKVYYIRVVKVSHHL